MGDINMIENDKSKVFVGQHYLIGSWSAHMLKSDPNRVHFFTYANGDSYDNVTDSDNVDYIFINDLSSFIDILQNLTNIIKEVVIDGED